MGDAEILRKQARAFMPMFADDGNAGLASQCLDAFRRFQIAKLTDTYMTLGVKEISRRKFEILGRGGDQEETERYVLGMIEREELRASLSHETPTNQADPGCIIYFHNKPQSEKRTLQALEAQIMRTVAITTQAKAWERSLGMSKEYLQFLNRNNKAGMGGSGSWFVDPDSMDTGELFDYGGRGSTGHSFEDPGDDDMMQQDSCDDEP